MNGVATVALVSAAALLAALLSIRSAVIQAAGDVPGGLASAVWPTHPRVELSQAFARIGHATANGRVPDQSTLVKVRSILNKAPLSAEPLLVEGTLAISQGQTRRGEDLLVESLSRDPRAMATRFILASLYLQQGRTGDGLSHVAALMRRMRGAAGPLAPSIAEFAKQPRAVPEVRRLLMRNPQLRSEVLATLASDPSNEGVVLELARDEPFSDKAPVWQTRLLAGLVSRNRFERAHSLWTSLSRVPRDRQQLLFNPQFKPSPAAPPFNWTLTSGAAGVAEPLSQGGGLQVLFYGRENAELASQTLVLRPGRYRLRSEVASVSTTSDLEWVVSCLPGKQVLGREPISGGQLDFSVPPGSCAGQQLSLQGLVSQSPSTITGTVRSVTLTRVVS